MHRILAAVSVIALVTIPALAKTKAGWLLGNTHGHSTHSDGASDVTTILQNYQAAGFDFNALTEHDTPRGPQGVFGQFYFYTSTVPGITVLNGMEITDGWGTPPPPPAPQFTYVHLIGLGVTKMVCNTSILTSPDVCHGAGLNSEPGNDPSVRTSRKNVILTDAQRIVNAGGLPILAHPVSLNDSEGPIKASEIPPFVHHIEIDIAGGGGSSDGITFAPAAAGEFLWNSILATGQMVYGINSFDDHRALESWDSVEGWVAVNTNGATDETSIRNAIRDGKFFSGFKKADTNPVLVAFNYDAVAMTATADFRPDWTFVYSDYNLMVALWKAQIGVTDPNIGDGRGLVIAKKLLDPSYPSRGDGCTLTDITLPDSTHQTVCRVTFNLKSYSNLNPGDIVRMTVHEHQDWPSKVPAYLLYLLQPFQITSSAADYSLSIGPSFQTVVPGATTSAATLTVNPTGGFGGSVSLTVSGLPSGAVPVFTPATTKTTAQLTITTSAGTPTGSYPLTIIGVSGSLSHTASMTLTVNSSQSTNSATFVKRDTTTQGSWRGNFGADGFSIAGDSTSLPSYALVNMSGQNLYTWTASTTDTRALQNGAGTSRIAAAWYSGANFSLDINLTGGAAHQIALYVDDWDNYNRAETIEVHDAGTGLLLDSEAVSNFSTGQYLVWSVTGHVTIKVIDTAGRNVVLSGLFFGGSPSALPSPPTSLSLDSPTGSSLTLTWTASTGPVVASGYRLDASTDPAFGSFVGTYQNLNVGNVTSIVLVGLSPGIIYYARLRAYDSSGNNSVNSARAQGQTVASGPPVISAVQANSVNLSSAMITWVTDQLADSQVDYGTSALYGFSSPLNSVLVTSHSIPLSGLTANTPYHYRVKSRNAPGTLTVSGDFGFTTQISASSAVFVLRDTSKQGNWIGTYGAVGYSLAADATSLPAYAQLTWSGQNLYTWVNGTTDPRALQKSGGSGRIAATWYAAANFSLDLNLTDGAAHQVAFYLVDWDGTNRSETIEIHDAGTGALLDSQSAAGFTAGQYLVWNLRGHVMVKVINTGNPNAVLSGVFFGN